MRTIGQAFRMVAKKVRFAVVTAHVKAQKDNAKAITIISKIIRGMKMMSQTNRLMAAIRPVLDEAVTKTRSSFAFNGVDSSLIGKLFRRIIVILRPKLPIEGLLYSVVVDFPPSFVTGVEDIGVWEESVAIVDDDDSTSAFFRGLPRFLGVFSGSDAGAGCNDEPVLHSSATPLLMK